jgi:hypothetical protein
MNRIFDQLCEMCTKSKQGGDVHGDIFDLYKNEVIDIINAVFPKILKTYKIADDITFTESSRSNRVNPSQSQWAEEEYKNLEIDKNNQIVQKKQPN